MKMRSEIDRPLVARPERGMVLVVVLWIVTLRGASSGRLPARAR